MDSDVKIARAAWKAAGLTFINSLLAVAIPVILNWANPQLLTLSDDIVVGFLVGIALTMSELLFFAYLLNGRAVEQVRLWQSKSAVDSQLSDIRSLLHELIDNSSVADDFFLEHYRYEIELLRTWLQCTVTRKEISIERHHIEATDALLALYDKKQHDTFRATHLLWETGEVFDVTYQFYFDAWLRRLRDEKVRTLKRMFVYNSEEDFGLPLARKLLAFHSNPPQGLFGKVISRKEFNRFKKDFHLTDGVEDFGIFSTEYLYLGSARNTEQISGTFSKDEARIRTYTGMFDALWDSPAAHPVTDYINAKITEAQLFDPGFMLPADTNQPSPQGLSVASPAKQGR